MKLKLIPYALLSLGLLTTAKGIDLFAPFEHVHFSKRGTPVAHPFGVEPAITGRDLFLDYSYRDGQGASEHEIEFELEWAITKHIGVILELPYIFEQEDGEATVDGIGDLAIVPRILLYEGERFLLTAQLEIIAPTGSTAFGGETAIAPGISTWHDLGNWWTLNTQFGVEHVFDENETELEYGIALIKTFDLSGRTTPAEDSHGHRSNQDLLNVHLEVTGSVGLQGEEEGILNAEGLFGISYGLSSRTDIRVGYEFPLSSPREFDSGVTAGLIWHF